MIDERRTCMRLQSHSCCCSVAAFHSCCEIAVMFGQNQKLTCMFQNILTSNALHSDKQITGYCWWSIRRYMQAAVERYLRQGPVGGKGDDDYDDDENAKWASQPLREGCLTISCTCSNDVTLPSVSIMLIKLKNKTRDTIPTWTCCGFHRFSIVPQGIHFGCQIFFGILIFEF